MLVLTDILGGSLNITPENSNNLARQKIASKKSLGWGTLTLLSLLVLVKSKETGQQSKDLSLCRTLGTPGRTVPHSGFRAAICLLPKSDSSRDGRPKSSICMFWVVTFAFRANSGQIPSKHPKPSISLSFHRAANVLGWQTHQPLG